MKIVIYGLTITSAWGNGHATTYRSLIKALYRLGHQVVFVEKDVEWYRDNRDLLAPSYCAVRLYDDWIIEERSLVAEAAYADAIVIGSYFPDAILATRALLTAGRGPVLFYDIDTPITISKLRDCGRTEYLEASLIPYYAAYLSFTGGPILDELEQRFSSPRAVAFYCSVDPELYRATAVQEEYRSDLSYLGTFAVDRQAQLMELLNGPAALLRANSFLVAGAMYPENVPWHANVRRLTHIAPPDHPAFYSSSRFTLNLTRSEMVDSGFSPSVRLFEASACGVAILSDQWNGIETFLTPEQEILLPRDAREAAYYLTEFGESERLQVGRRARERILAEHTSDHRAKQFEDIVVRCATPVR